MAPLGFQNINTRFVTLLLRVVLRSWRVTENTKYTRQLTAGIFSANSGFHSDFANAKFVLKKNNKGTPRGILNKSPGGKEEPTVFSHHAQHISWINAVKATNPL